MGKRVDSIGLFWEDLSKIKKEKKEKVKRLPPEPFWLEPDYLPGLEEAINFKPDLYTDEELVQAAHNFEPLLFDIECYPNYCLFAFKGVDTGKVVYLEFDNDFHDRLWDEEIAKLNWILHHFCIINFNGRKYDFPVTTLALAGYGTEDLWDATQMIIEFQLQAQEVYKKYKTKPLQINQVDLIELTALGPGLKVVAGRLHAKRMQDLPFKPGSFLTENQIAITRRYCINDLDNTGLLYRNVKKLIDIRASQGDKYGLDLRSHSDAQMAEAIIASEVRRISGRKHLKRLELPNGTNFKYQVPAYIKYSTPLMNWVLDTVRNATFFVDDMDGAVIIPPELANMAITMNKSTYQMGIGGLHSKEKSIAHVSDDEYVVVDTDVTSYYPYLIVNAGLVPENLGSAFLQVYYNILQERVAAKKNDDKIMAEVLKIVVNGSFGKLGSKWSILYAPNLLIQVTLTGQLSILMLAERFELAGIEVTSVNTDGIVVKCKRSLEHIFHQIVTQWEQETGLGTEETRYRATYSKDINNYIAVYETPQKGKLFKTKGLYAETAPKKNAVNEVCIEALKAYIEHGTKPEDFIPQVRDITQFTTMRRVNGGAVKLAKDSFNPNATESQMIEAVKAKGAFPQDELLWRFPGEAEWEARSLRDAYAVACQSAGKGQYLGTIIRWYYGTNAEGEIIAAKTGNKVPRSEGAQPLMDLPDEFPTDIDYQWYITETYNILANIGHTPKESQDEQEPV